MLCKNCKLKEICKTYDFIRNIDHAAINISDCKYNEYSFNSDKKTSTIKEIEGMETNIANEIKKRREKRIFGNTNNIQKKQDKKKNTEYINCPTCNAVTVSDDIKLCSKCNKRVCSACSTEANGQIFCDECWSGKKKEPEEVIKEVDKLNKDATAAQKKSAKLKDSLLNDSIKHNTSTIKAIIPKTSKSKK